jgi:hypothetical protein
MDGPGAAVITDLLPATSAFKDTGCLTVRAGDQPGYYALAFATSPFSIGASTRLPHSVQLPS